MAIAIAAAAAAVATRKRKLKENEDELKKLPNELQKICKNYTPITLYEVVYFYNTAYKSNYVDLQAQATFLFDSLFSALHKCVTFLDEKLCTVTDVELQILTNFLSDNSKSLSGRFWFKTKDAIRRDKHPQEVETFVLVRERLLNYDKKGEEKLVTELIDECFIYNIGLIMNIRNREIYNILMKMNQSEIDLRDEDEIEEDLLD